jgi:hypothetical protein
MRLRVHSCAVLPRNVHRDPAVFVTATQFKPDHRHHHHYLIPNYAVNQTEQIRYVVTTLFVEELKT